MCLKSQHERSLLVWGQLGLQKKIVSQNKERETEKDGGREGGRERGRKTKEGRKKEGGKKERKGRRRWKGGTGRRTKCLK